MARVANMSMALFEGLMEYFREVYDLEEPAPMVARLLRGHDKRNVAFVIQHGRNLDKSSPARAALDLFAKGNVIDVALLNKVIPNAYWLYVAPLVGSRGLAELGLKPVFKEF
jgi:hypothetical protein